VSRGEEAPGRLRISSEGGIGRRGRLILTLLAVLAILMVTGLFAVRTEGGKDFLRDHLAGRLGMEISIDAVRIGWPYDLVVRGMESDGYGPNAPGFGCRELRFGIGLGPLYRVSVTGPELVLAKDADGRWTPAAFSPLGKLASGGILEISRMTESSRRRVSLAIEDGSVRWLDGPAALRAEAKGIAFRLCPVDIPGRQMYYYSLSVDSAVDAAGSRALGVRREWLASATIEYLEISAAGEEFAGARQAFWEVGQ